MTNKEGLILALAVWRLSHMTAWEDGILGINDWIRNELIQVEGGWKKSELLDRVVKFTEDDQYLPIYQYCEAPPALQDTLLKKGIKCVYCISFWFSLLAFGLYRFFPQTTIKAATPLALNALAIWANRLITE